MRQKRPSAAQFDQVFSYDRYGNRTINNGATWGVSNPQFGVDTSTNRLTAPAGYSMAYDQAGNLTTDTYTGQGTRTYDAENRMKQAWANNQWQTYVYDGGGARVKRIVNGAETWQVYGLGGELLAEYAATASPSSPQKEYGYRNGELLVTASNGSGCGVGYQGSKTWLGTNASLVHLTGQAEGTNWAVYVGTHSATAMVYGPYDNTFGQGEHTAQFTLMVDNNSGSDVVATLDVVTGYGANVLAQRQIRRNEFTAANQWQTFTLSFNNPCFGFVEGRVWWAGNTNSKFAQLTISLANVHWLVTDQLGTPRMVFDQTGSLANVSRHDYLPFGEELFAGTGGRTQSQGYSVGDGVRQKFTEKERDNETGLDYFGARYYGSTQGRFTSVDPFDIISEAKATAETNPDKAQAQLISYLGQPQNWNRYAYVRNNPLKYVDPTGELIELTGSEEEQKKAFERIKYMVGREGAKYLDMVQMCHTLTAKTNPVIVSAEAFTKLTSGTLETVTRSVSFPVSFEKSGPEISFTVACTILSGQSSLLATLNGRSCELCTFLSRMSLVLWLNTCVIYNEQRKIMNDTRDVMIRQTSIMEKTLLMNRAYVGVVSLTANTKDGKVTLLLENIGRLPADKVTLDVRETRRIEESSNGSISHLELGQPLVPGGKTAVIIELAKFTSQETEKIASKTERLFVSGKITYEDGFGNPNTFNLVWPPEYAVGHKKITC